MFSLFNCSQRCNNPERKDDDKGKIDPEDVPKPLDESLEPRNTSDEPLETSGERKVKPRLSSARKSTGCFLSREKNSVEVDAADTTDAGTTDAASASESASHSEGEEAPVETFASQEGVPSPGSSTPSSPLSQTPQETNEEPVLDAATDVPAYSASSTQDFNFSDSDMDEVAPGRNDMSSLEKIKQQIAALMKDQENWPDSPGLDHLLDGDDSSNDVNPTTVSAGDESRQKSSRLLLFSSKNEVDDDIKSSNVTKTDDTDLDIDDDLTQPGMSSSSPNSLNTRSNQERAPSYGGIIDDSDDSDDLFAPSAIDLVAKKLSSNPGGLHLEGVPSLSDDDDDDDEEEEAVMG